MSLTSAEKAEVIKTYQSKPGDTGSPEVQIAVMTARIKKLTEHFKTHQHDHHSRRGLLRVINGRRKLLTYLHHTDIDRYRDLIKRLGLRR